MYDNNFLFIEDSMNKDHTSVLLQLKFMYMNYMFM